MALQEDLVTTVTTVVETLQGLARNIDRLNDAVHEESSRSNALERRIVDLEGKVYDLEHQIRDLERRLSDR